MSLLAERFLTLSDHLFLDRFQRGAQLGAIERAPGMGVWRSEFHTASFCDLATLLSSLWPSSLIIPIPQSYYRQQEQCTLMYVKGVSKTGKWFLNVPVSLKILCWYCRRPNRQRPGSVFEILNTLGTIVSLIWVSLSVVSVTGDQLQSENIKWKIPKKIVSFKLCAIMNCMM